MDQENSYREERRRRRKQPAGTLKSEDISGGDVGRENISESYRKLERCPEDIKQAVMLEKLRCSGFLGGLLVMTLRFH